MGATDSGEPCCYCEHWLAEEAAKVEGWTFFLVKDIWMDFKPLR